MRALSMKRAPEKSDAGPDKDRSSTVPTVTTDGADSTMSEEGVLAQRKVFVNLPLDKELLDEDGAPLQQFSRNKIRTAKYTPLIFVPKNLFLQFHNVANVYFLFVTILAVRGPRCCGAGGENDGLTVGDRFSPFSELQTPSWVPYL